uniref:11-beta-hydroxysteroid dehydrogenase 1 n=1 Tax=Leptobrachium leishanense TaxID=445787 RepID=A0A8C5LX19_9ANUR
KGVSETEKIKASEDSKISAKSSPISGGLIQKLWPKRKIKVSAWWGVIRVKQKTGGIQATRPPAGHGAQQPLEHHPRRSLLGLAKPAPFRDIHRQVLWAKPPGTCNNHQDGPRRPGRIRGLPSGVLSSSSYRRRTLQGRTSAGISRPPHQGKGSLLPPAIEGAHQTPPFHAHPHQIRRRVSSRVQRTGPSILQARQSFGQSRFTGGGKGSDGQSIAKRVFAVGRRCQQEEQHVRISRKSHAKGKKGDSYRSQLRHWRADGISLGKDGLSHLDYCTDRRPTQKGGLDMLILNHIGYTYFNYFDGDVDHVRDLLEINVLSYATMTVAALPMLKKSSGNVVVVSSVAGKVATPLTVPYSTTKFALDGFFSSLRMEFKQQNTNVSITLCVISYIDTDSAVNTVAGVIQQPAAPKEECAFEIIKGGALRQREVYYQYQATKIPLLLRDWAPEFLEYIMLKNYDVTKLKPQQ